jgi:hypothetical protein
VRRVAEIESLIPLVSWGQWLSTMSTKPKLTLNKHVRYLGKNNVLDFLVSEF